MNRELNWAGHSADTIAAEYETDAALVDAGGNGEDPYFLAAWRAESDERDRDTEAAK